MDDKIVCEIVGAKIQDCEKKNKGWIVLGFPRTREQAQSISKMKIIPDKIINLTVNESEILSMMVNKAQAMGISQCEPPRRDCSDLSM